MEAFGRQRSALSSGESAAQRAASPAPSGWSTVLPLSMMSNRAVAQGVEACEAQQRGHASSRHSRMARARVFPDGRTVTTRAKGGAAHQAEKDPPGKRGPRGSGLRPATGGGEPTATSRGPGKEVALPRGEWTQEKKCGSLLQRLAWGVYEPIGRALGESPTGGDLLDDHHGHRFSFLGPYFFPRGDVKGEFLSGGVGGQAESVSPRRKALLSRGDGGKGYWGKQKVMVGH